MCDETDVASEREEMHRQIDLQNTLDRLRKQHKSRPQCEHCEEFPVEVTALGSYLRYCPRCKSELQNAQKPLISDEKQRYNTQVG